MIYHLRSIKEQDISYSFSHCSNHQAALQVLERKEIYYRYLKTYTRQMERGITANIHQLEAEHSKCEDVRQDAPKSGDDALGLGRTCTRGWR